MNAPLATIDTVLKDPGWFPDEFDPRTGAIGFTEATRAQIAAQPFLDMRWDRAGHRRGRLHLSAVTAGLSQIGSPPPNLRFIWHTGFCCSTLLAKALDSPERNLSLCEPKLLVDAADAKRAGAFAVHPDLAKLADTAFSLLGRGFEPGETVTIKPAPAANHLLPDARALAGSRHLLLFSDCESFVISIAKSGSQGAGYARAMLGVLLRDGIAPEWTDERTRGLSIHQTAALVWHLQIAELRAHGCDGRSLDCDALLEHPNATLIALDAFFGLALGERQIAETAAGPLFRRNAKNPGEVFDVERRSRESAAVRQSLGNELQDAIAWSYEAHGKTPRDYPLSNPLIRLKKAYA